MGGEHLPPVYKGGRAALDGRGTFSTCGKREEGLPCLAGKPFPPAEKRRGGLL